MKKRIYSPAASSLGLSRSLSLSLYASLSSSGAQLSPLLRAIYAKGNGAYVCASAIEPLDFRWPKTRVCEGARLRSNSRPSGNQEVGGPDREGSSSSTQADSRWMNGSLSGAGADGKRLLPARHLDPPERTRNTGFTAENTAAAALFRVNFL